MRYKTEQEGLKGKQLKFKRTLFGLKSPLTFIYEGLNVTKTPLEISQGLYKSGLVSSLEEAENKVKELIGGQMEVVNTYDRMEFEKVTNRKGNEMIRVSYLELDSRVL